MKIWRRASGVLKDKNSIWVAKLSRRTAFRNRHLETAIIKATSHDESFVDYKNSQRVFTWVRTSPAYFRPLIWILSTRMEKTRSWVVALKGLILMHGVFCCKIPAARMIKRLPFDLSNFNDGHSKPVKTWGFSSFVRAYFAFLDHRCAFLSGDSSEEQEENKESSSMVQVLVKLQQLQSLLDILLQIRPNADGMIVVLILEAMDCVIIEIFDVYRRICNGVARVLVGIYAAGKVEAAMALCVLKKAASQGEELSSYFEFCRDIGVLNASEFPKIEQIPEDDIRDLERIIHGVSDKWNMGIFDTGSIDEQEDSKTIITENWEVFDDQLQVNGEGGGNFSDVQKGNHTDPFDDSVDVPPLEHEGFPNLIGFV
ncbi:hypothetical protein HHK36_024179 [Tetracentron sinense]|uniref:ENTH domain-containing protein n=1 Tax=Tetracentron sinense TaxID=13715 RepID=A0A834YKF1_TETSI|nr:hypothetical protein HHK36_024179 [Tetracentron sinense]